MAPRSLGRFRFRAKLTRIPGRRGRLVPIRLTVRDASGRVIERTKLKRRAGRRAIVKVNGVAVAGRYTWRVTRRGRVLDRGVLTARPQAGLTMSSRKVLVATAR